MPPILLDILLEANGRLLCVVSVIAVFLILGLAKRPSRKCPRCRTLNRPAARYCAQCGARLNHS